MKIQNLRKLKFPSQTQTKRDCRFSLSFSLNPSFLGFLSPKNHDLFPQIPPRIHRIRNLIQDLDSFLRLRTSGSRSRFPFWYRIEKKEKKKKKMMMMMVSAGGKPLRNLVRRWQDLSGGQGLRIPLSGRSGVEGSGENPADLLLDPDPDPDPGEGPAKVPRGYLAVYVGPDMRRFVIPARYLGVPAMRVLMERAAEEFGYEQRGGLRIPCEEASFQEILSVLDRRRRKKKKKLMLM